MSRHLEVLRSGPLTTVQDSGRPGHRAAGVSPSGAADRGGMARANALVGNPAGRAVLEATFGGLMVRALDGLVLSITGAICPGATMDTRLELAAGDTLTLDGARHGVRTYVAVGGGIDVPSVLGSRSTDTLSRLGPPPLVVGQRLPVGSLTDTGERPGIPGRAVLPEQAVTWLDLLRGPRDDWLSESAWERLAEVIWEVSPDSNRVAVRLSGPPLPVALRSLPPEPLVRGAVQVPPDGRPIVFLADHPVTGGYPVVGVLTATASDLIAQCRPGAGVSLREAASAHRDDGGAAGPPG